MTNLIEKPLKDEEVVDHREVKRSNKWTAIAQLATEPSKIAKKIITDINSNYINSQIHNNSNNTIAASIPNSAAGMIRINIHSSAPNNDLVMAEKKEILLRRLQLVAQEVALERLAEVLDN